MSRRMVIPVLAAILALVGSSAVMAQYPTPIGNISQTVSETEPEAGSTVSVTVSVTGIEGEAVEGASCTARVREQPGSGATVEPTTFTVGASGRATLDVTAGDTAGTVQISVRCQDPDGNTLSSQLSFTVTAAEEDDAEEDEVEQEEQPPPTHPGNTASIAALSNSQGSSGIGSPVAS